MAELAHVERALPPSGVSRCFLARSPQGRPCLVQEFSLDPSAGLPEGTEVTWSLLGPGSAFIKNMIPCTLGVGEATKPATEEEDAFRREMLGLMRLQVVGFPAVLHAGVGEGRGLVIYQGGAETLAEQVARDGPWDAERVKQLAERLIGLVGALHRRHPPVVLGEVCPSNLYLDEEGQLQALTYGELRFLAPGQRGRSPALHSPFLPPERRSQAAEGLGTDIYCIGATLYFMLTGQAPALDHDATRPPHEVNPQVPADLSEVVMTCLETNPALRHATCSDLRDALAGRAAERSAQPGPIILVDRAEVVENDVGQGTHLSGSFTVTNAGGGTLIGAIESEFSWLVVDPTRLEGNRVCVQYRISTATLQAGMTHRARIRLGVLHHDDEIRAARGQRQIDVPVSVSIREARSDRVALNVGQLVRALLPLAVVAFLVAKAAGVSFSGILSALGLQ